MFYLALWRNLLPNNGFTTSPIGRLEIGSLAYIKTFPHLDTIYYLIQNKHHIHFLQYLKKNL